MKINSQTRNQSLINFKSKKYDLVIIGGGITGAGIARDAASRGMSVCLLEANDFAQGTSSRSSKLIHGGIRYLENYDFKLVFEALSERSHLFEMAPHLVHPLQFQIPIFKESRVSYFLMGVGMWLYDILSLFQAPEPHRGMNSFDSLSFQPLLKKENLIGSYLYWDAYMDDDRLAIETVRSAHSFGADSANFTRVEHVQKIDDGYSVEFVDVLNKKNATIATKSVISCVGPWTDILGSKVNSKWEKKLRATKGVHLILPKEKLELNSAVVMGAEKGNRIIFGIPRGNFSIIGTTDTDFDGNPENVNTSIEDVNYLLNIVNSYFPKAQIRPQDIVSSYSGVRPLVSDGSSSEGKTSREHLIFKDNKGMYFIAGGKYTTYRKMAQDAVEKILTEFSIEDKFKFRESKSLEPLNPLVNKNTYEQLMCMQDDPIMSSRAQKYGSEMMDVFKPYLNYNSIQLEARFHIENTMCLRIIDFFKRRTNLYLTENDHGLRYFDDVAVVFKNLLNFSEKEIEAEKTALLEAIKYEMPWKSFIQ